MNVIMYKQDCQSTPQGQECLERFPALTITASDHFFIPSNRRSSLLETIYVETEGESATAVFRGAVSPDASQSTLGSDLNWMIERTHFDPRIVETDRFNQLITTYGQAAVQQAINTIEQVVANQLSENETIFHGLEMLEHAFKNGHHFTGTLVVKELRSNEYPVLEWQESPEGTVPLESGIHCQTDFVKEQLQSGSIKEKFESEEEMFSAFTYLRKTLPRGFKQDGCDMRCMWICFLLENVLKIKYEKYKVAHNTSLHFKTSPPFDEGVKWRMHTAPVVICDGEKYVFDVLLGQPIPLNEWTQSLHSNPKDLTTEISSSWDSNANTSFKELIEELRGLYLFEMVDDNKFYLKEFGVRTTRRTNGWMSWLNRPTGFAPSKTPEESFIGERLMIVNFSRIGNGQFSPVLAKQALTEDCIEGEDGLFFQNQNLQAKYELLKKNNKLRESRQSSSFDF